MTNRVIPEAAVEAAAKADYGNGDQYGTWATEPNEVREMYLKDARRILEAAAPHILRDAWEAGCKEGLSWNPGYDDKALAENPYGTAK